MKIITQQIDQPIPLTNFDWTAVFDNYEPGDAQGWGPSKDDAITDFMNKHFREEMQ